MNNCLQAHYQIFCLNKNGLAGAMRNFNIEFRYLSTLIRIILFCEIIRFRENLQRNIKMWNFWRSLSIHSITRLQVLDTKILVKLLQIKWVSPNVGLEPTTLRLRVSCSTDWASRACIRKTYFDKLILKMLHGLYKARKIKPLGI